MNHADTVIVDIRPSTPSQPKEVDNCFSTEPGFCQASSACQSTLPLSGASESTQQFTDESNNLSVVPQTQRALALTGGGNANLEMQYLASTGSTPECDTTTHVFIKDYDQDTGSTPSNLGGQAFWESPDVMLVAAGGQPTDTPITQVIAGQMYSIWIAAHNDWVRERAGRHRACASGTRASCRRLGPMSSPTCRTTTLRPASGAAECRDRQRLQLEPYTVTNANNVTTVQLISTSFVALPPVALASNQTVSVSSKVIALSLPKSVPALI